MHRPDFSDELTSENFAALRYPAMPKAIPLTALAIDWILYLPAEIRPQALAKQFPRIANALAAAWNHPEKFMAHMKELTADHRGNRLGFPEQVARELENVQQYYATLSQQRSTQSAWDSHPAGLQL